MTVLEWDQVGERIYQTGVERGVLYLKDGTVVPWNGITSIEDTSDTEQKSYYLDGVKIVNHVTSGDFSGKLSAFTYPTEFDKVMGNADVSSGLIFANQKIKSFNLSYRTLIGNDTEGIEYGYKIHLLYNLMATSDSDKFETLKDQLQANEFVWSLSGLPVTFPGHRPTSHVIIDSRDTDPEILQTMEDTLYGTDDSDPRFPTIIEVGALFGILGELIIVDNGDGTWTAIDDTGNYISMISDTLFKIENANIEYLDATTFTISSTNV